MDNALTEAGIASSGIADSFLEVSHQTRTKHTHQVTALVLAKLQDDAFLHCEGLQLRMYGGRKWCRRA